MSDKHTPRRAYLRSLAGVVGGATFLTHSDTAKAVVENPLAEEDLISWWPFDEDFRDAVGDNDATADMGKPAIETHQGRAGVTFDGDDGLMINKGPNEELSILERSDGPASISTWVYFDQKTGNRTPNDGSTPHTIMRRDTDFKITASPVEDAEAVELSFVVHNLSGGESYNTAKQIESDELEVPVGEWHHVSFVIDPASSITCYINGQERFFDNQMDGYSPHSEPYWDHETIGGWYGTNNPRWFHLMRGALSDFRIYGTGLSKTEIQTIYTNTGGTFQKPSSLNKQSGTSEKQGNTGIPVLKRFSDSGSSLALGILGIIGGASGVVFYQRYQGDDSE